MYLFRYLQLLSVSLDFMKYCEVSPRYAGGHSFIPSLSQYQPEDKSQWIGDYHSLVNTQQFIFLFVNFQGIFIGKFHLHITAAKNKAASSALVPSLESPRFSRKHRKDSFFHVRKKCLN